MQRNQRLHRVVIAQLPRKGAKLLQLLIDGRTRRFQQRFMLLPSVGNELAGGMAVNKHARQTGSDQGKRQQQDRQSNAHTAPRQTCRKSFP